MTALPMAEAAVALGVSTVTLRRWLRDGCPVARRGRRGRGCATLIDIAAARVWRHGNAGASTDRLVLEMAGDVPVLLAGAAFESWRLSSGVDKRRLAAMLAGTWYLSATAVLDHLRERCPAVPELTALPEEIERLKKLSGG